MYRLTWTVGGKEEIDVYETKKELKVGAAIVRKHFPDATNLLAWKEIPIPPQTKAEIVEA